MRQRRKRIGDSDVSSDPHNRRTASKAFVRSAIETYRLVFEFRTDSGPCRSDRDLAVGGVRRRLSDLGKSRHSSAGPTPRARAGRTRYPSHRPVSAEANPAAAALAVDAEPSPLTRFSGEVGRVEHPSALVNRASVPTEHK